MWSDEKAEPRCVCGLCRVTTGTIITGIGEFLIICHTLIFAFSNYSAGEDRYNIYNPIMGKVMKYDYLLPFLVVQLLWLVACVILLIGVKVPFHWLLLPHLAVQILIVLGGTTLTIMAIYNMQSVDQISWELMAALTFCVLVSVSEIYLSYVVILCFKYLKRQREITAQERRWMNSQETDPRGWSSRAASRHQSAAVHPTAQSIQMQSLPTKQRF